jgi:hypothetical protein
LVDRLVPIPVPPIKSNEPFKIETEWQKPIPGPIPAEKESPDARMTPPSIDWSVMFDPKEQSIAGPVIADNMLISVMITIAELPEITTGWSALSERFDMINVTSALRISMAEETEVPVTTNSDLE